MKFKNDIEVQAGIKDSSGSDGTLGQVLSSTVSGVSWITPPVGVTGSGTTNFLPKWNSSTGLTDSIIFNNGNGVTIGATSSSPNSGWRLNIHPASTQAGLGIFCYNNNSLHGLRIEMTGTGDFIQARDVATQNDVFSVSYLGNTTANSFIKIGGTSSQYLMADGSISTGPSVSGFVPYTGANQNVNLGEYGLSGGYLTFDTTPTGTPTSQGTMYWDDAKSTVSLIMNGTIQHIGQDSFYYAKNSSGSSIPKGTAVRFAGTDGASGHILIAPMIANGTVPSSYYMGITSETIANGAFGQVMAFGELEGVNTSAYTAGSLLYVSTTVAGGFQTTVPVAPNNIILAAATLNSKSNGALIVRATLGSNINSDEGVKIVSPTTGDLLQLQSNGLWENKSVASLGLVPLNGTGFVRMSGTTPSYITGSSDQYVKADGSLSTALNSRVEVNFIATSGQTTFTTPYEVGQVEVYYNGSKLYPDEFVATNGTTIVLVTPATLNAQISIVKFVSSFNTTSIRNESIFTTTAGQTTFSVNYAIGQVDVFYNGSKLNTSEFTATNGTSVVLGFACQAGESIAIISYVNQVSGAVGTANKVAKFTGVASLGDSQIDDNGTNVSIGYTTNPNAHKLDVNGTGRFSGTGLNASVRITNTTASTGKDWNLYSLNNGNFGLYNNTDGLYSLISTPSGNVGIGVTPSAWSSIFRVNQIGNNGGFLASRADGINQIQLGVNGYFNGTNWIYSVNESSSKYYQAGGIHYWETAPSGTAGNTISFTQAMTLNAMGNLGIGVFNPDIFARSDARNVGISASGSSDNMALQLNAGGSAGRGAQIYMGQGGTRHFTISSNATETTVGTSTNTPLRLATNDSERIRIFANGNVGINTGNIDAGFRLDVNGTGRFATSLTVGAGGLAGRLSVRGTTNDSSAFAFEAANSSGNSLFLVRNDGNVGIGTTPLTALTVKSTNDNGYALTRPSNGSVYHWRLSTTEAGGDAYTVNYNTFNNNAIFTTYAGGGTGGNVIWRTGTSGAGSEIERMRITSGGTIGIGGGADINNAGLDRLSIGFWEGNYGWIQTWGGKALYLNNSGNAVYAGSQRIDNNSDERIKDNIVSIKNALETVLLLNGKKYNMLDENNILRYGFIAQEVQPHLSDFVTESNRSFEKDNVKIENLLTLESSGTAWAALLVEAIKEQQAQIKELQDEIISLKNK